MHATADSGLRVAITRQQAEANLLLNVDECDRCSTFQKAVSEHRFRRFMNYDSGGHNRDAITALSQEPLCRLVVTTRLT